MSSPSESAHTPELGWVLSSALSVAIITTTQSGLVTGFSHGAELMLGYQASEVVGRVPVTTFHDPQELQARIQSVSREVGRVVAEMEVFTLAVAPGKAQEGEWTYVRKDGSRLTVRLSVTELSTPDGQVQGYLGTAIDISELRQTEMDLRQEKHLIDQVINSLPGIFYLYDADLRLRRWNRNHETLLGYSAQEMEGKFLGDWHATAEGKALAIQASRGVLERGGSPDAVESSLHHKNGKPIPFLLTGVRIETSEGPFLAGVGIDLTERRRLEEQLRHSQKMESVGRLAGGVAHDFNNLLTAILGNLDLADASLPSDSPARKYLNNILNAAESASMLTRQLLAFSRKEVVAPRILDLNRSLLNLKGMLGRLLGEDIELRVKPTEGLWPITIDPGQLDQILMNLTVNARDAMPDGGVLSFETSNTSLDANYVFRHGEAIPGEYVMLSISDTGMGMGPEVLEHIFEPFFTTKEMGRGTGLGLATVFGALKQNRGLIDVYSEAGLGTTFRIYLPKAEGQITPALERPSPVSVQGSGETILIAEDDERIRTIAEECLTRLGYRVLACSDGATALKAGLGAGTINLLLTDLIMPDMNGKELSERMSTMQPRLKILYCSGYTADIIGRHGMLEPGVAFLPKPYTPSELARRVIPKRFQT